MSQIPDWANNFGAVGLVAGVLLVMWYFQLRMARGDADARVQVERDERKRERQSLREQIERLEEQGAVWKEAALTEKASRELAERTAHDLYSNGQLSLELLNALKAIAMQRGA